MLLKFTIHCNLQYEVIKTLYYIKISFFQKDILKDEKDKLGRINELWMIYWYCVNNM